jgi:hypothetical protein
MPDVDREFAFQHCSDFEIRTLPNLRCGLSASKPKLSLRPDHNRDHLRANRANPNRSNLTAEFNREWVFNKNAWHRLACQIQGVLHPTQLMEHASGINKAEVTSAVETLIVQHEFRVLFGSPLLVVPIEHPGRVHCEFAPLTIRKLLRFGILKRKHQDLGTREWLPSVGSVDD